MTADGLICVCVCVYACMHVCVHVYIGSSRRWAMRTLTLRWLRRFSGRILLGYVCVCVRVRVRVCACVRVCAHDSCQELALSRVIH